MLSLLVAASVAVCPSFSEDQHNALHKAYVVAEDSNATVDSGVLFASLVWQESFIGDQIIRFNPNDGLYGSYGLAQMQITTAYHILDIPFNNSTKSLLMDDLIVDFLKDDFFALDISFSYLLGHLNNYSNPWNAVARYNGSGTRADNYSKLIKTKYELLMACNYFDFITQ
jgi:hypothetical protein